MLPSRDGDASEASIPEFPHPVFVGGTGRSGTTVVARLIAQHSRFAMINREARFHVDGLPDLLAGRRSKRAFLRRLRDYWYFRVIRDGTERGFRNQVPPEDFDRAVQAFSLRFRADPEDAARRLLRDLFDTYAQRQGKPSWVEMTPANVESATTLYALFPSMRLVHVVRDGRDVACSALPLEWSPGTLAECLEWWASRLRRAHEATSQIPRESVLVIRFEDLVRDDREDAYERLIAFLELPDEPRMGRWFEANVSEERAHIGRWRQDLSSRERADFERSYRKLTAELASEGIVCIRDP